MIASIIATLATAACAGAFYFMGYRKGYIRGGTDYAKRVIADLEHLMAERAVRQVTVQKKDAP